jgi:hypothetical protein
MAPHLHVVLLIKRCYCAQFGAFNPLRKHPCTYPPHYIPFLLVEKHWLNQNRFIFMCFWVGSEHEPVFVLRSNWICQIQNSRLKTFYSKAFVLPYSWKKTCKFTETVRLFVCFLPVFSNFRTRSCFISFIISIFVSLALKIHNCTDPKLVRKQHWNFNEFNFYIW